MYILKGVERKTLTFTVWDFVTGQMDPMSQEERWETTWLDWAEENEQSGSLTISRTATSSVPSETLQMALWSLPLVTLTMMAMFSYVIWVFYKGKAFLKPRAKLAIAGKSSSPHPHLISILLTLSS